MKQAQMEALMDKHYADMKKKFFEKARDYGSDGDVLADFKQEAVDLDTSWFKVWHVFAYKHWRAVTAYARRHRIESEPIEQRIEDVIGYQFLLLGLIEDAKEGERRADPRVDIKSVAGGIVGAPSIGSHL